MARKYVLAWRRSCDSWAIKRRQYFVNKYGPSIYTKFLLSMLLHVYSECALDFLSLSAFLDLHSIRDDEATTSKQLIFFNALTDIALLHGKTQLKMQNMMSYESIHAFPKISPNYGFR